MAGEDELARRFEAERRRLRALAYRMLGSLSEVDDAVQEAWLRLSAADAAQLQNLGGWLTTVTSRICLDLLRTRATRREESLEVHVPDPVVTIDAYDPEQEAVLADSIGLALLVVLDTLSPAERLAFVLHDLFGVGFAEIARMLDRSPDAAKQLASRGRRRLHGAPVPESDIARQRDVVDAFLAAARAGDFDGLLALLDPDVLLRADAGTSGLGLSRTARGRAAVAAQVLGFAHMARFARPALVNGSPGLVAAPDGRIVAVLDLTVHDGRIREINILADPDRLARLT